MLRSVALAAAIAVAFLAVSGAGGSPAQTPKRGGTVIVFAQAEPPCLNPLLEPCVVTTSAGTDEVLEGAYEVGPHGTRPNLVSGVTYTKRPPFTLTYHIRPQARWSDRVPITARDFVFTDTAIRKYVPRDTEIADLSYHVTTVRSVSALDAKTVRVVVKAGTAGWQSLFGIVLPWHALRGRDLGSEDLWRDRIDNPNTGEPIASGPFLVDRWEPGKQLTLVRNPRYWGPHPAYLDRLVLRFDVDDSAEALRTGELDVVPRRPDLGTEPGVQTVYGPGRIWAHFAIRSGRGGHPALTSKLVRRALAYGLDRVAIVRATWGQFLPKWRPSESAVFLSATRYYQPNWSGYRYRAALASRLLEQAGCSTGADGIYVCAGERLSLRFVTPAGGPLRRIALELAQRQLRRVGIEVTLGYAPGAAFFDQIVLPGDFDVALFTWFYGPRGVGGVGAADIFRCGGPKNYTGYCQRLVTRDLDQAEQTLDLENRARLLNRADREMAKDVPVIPLWTEPEAATVRSTIRGFAPNFPSLAWNAENWWLDR